MRFSEPKVGGTYETNNIRLRHFPSDGEADLVDFALARGGGGAFGAFFFLAGLELGSESAGRLLLRVREAGPSVGVGLEVIEGWISSMRMEGGIVDLEVGMAVGCEIDVRAGEGVDFWL